MLGGTQFDLTGAKSELCSRLDCVAVSSEAQARQMVESGDALAALILPPDLITGFESLGGLNPTQPTVRVLVNEEDPVKAGAGRRSDRLARHPGEPEDLEGGLAGSRGSYLTLLTRGGTFSLLGQTLDILGLRNDASTSSRRFAPSCRPTARSPPTSTR